MTVQTDTLYVDGTGNDVATVFSFSPIVISGADDLVVTKIASDGTETPLSRGSSSTTYSVGISEYPATGSITYPASGGTPLATGERIRMRRVLDLLQETNLRNQGPYNASTLEQALDRLVWYDQQQQEQIDRSLKLPVGATPTSGNTEIPEGEGYLYMNDSDEWVKSPGGASVAISSAMTPVVQASTVSNALTELGVSTFAKTILDDTSAAAVRTTIGAGTGDLTNPMTTPGDTIYGGASGAPTRLPKGMDGQVLTLASGVPSWATPAAGAAIQSGTILDFGGRTAPSGYLLCDGSAVSRSTYADLYAALNPSLGTFTVTIASPAVFSKTAHGLSVGDRVRLTTSGALPTGLTAGNDYYVISAGLTADAFEVSSTLNGSAVNTSGSQSGTHSAQFYGFGLGDGSTTFNVPDLRGIVTAGRDDMGGSAASRLTTGTGGFGQGTNLGNTGGAQSVALSTAELASHAHGSVVTGVTNATDGQLGGSGAGYVLSATTGNSGSAGSGNAHANTQPTMIVNKIIKT